MDEDSHALWREFHRAARAPLEAAVVALRDAQAQVTDDELEVVVAPGALPGVTHLFGHPVTRSMVVGQGEALIFNRTRLRYFLERPLDPDGQPG